MSKARPNILILMVDQLSARALAAYGHHLVKSPHIDEIAARGTVFEHFYSNFPLCAPARLAFMTGRLCSTIGAWDNAAQLPSDIPTFAHYLRLLGYRTCLSGKMHFIGPDQLHGFAERLTTDIYPADFAWTPNWAAGPADDKPSGISMNNVLQAGPCVRSLQMDYDDEVEHFAVQRLYDLAREPEATRKPFFLTVSFSHPHPPFTAGQAHWDRYTDDEIDAPAVPPIPVGQRDAQSQWLHASHGADRQPVTADHVRAARRAYYAMVSYVDDKVGCLLETLRLCGFADDTIVVFTADHGEMLGERGMFYKQSFFEASVRVPLIVCAPGRFAARRVAAPMSLVDLLPTFIELAGGNVPWPEPMDGVSLVPLLEGVEASFRSVISEYTDMGVIAPCRMVRQGRWKYVYTHGHPAQLFDLEADPRELSNRAGQPLVAEVEARLLAAVLAGWDADAVHRDVLASQRRRLFLKQAAAASGVDHDWSWQATRDDHRRFVRASGAAGAKARARFPFVR